MHTRAFTLFCLIALGVAMTGCAQRRNSAASGGAAAEGVASGLKAEAVDRLNDASQIVNELIAAPDSKIPQTVLAQAKCVAVVPEMFRGGFVIGARHGRGVATCRNQARWSAPAFFTITGGSWGAQIGGQSTDLVMLFMDQKGMEDLLNANVSIGGGVSAAAGPVGRTAEAATDYKLESQILTYSRSKGLYAGATLDGAYIRVDEETTRSFYGRSPSFRLTLSGEQARPQLAQKFLNTIDEAFRAARAAT